MQTSSMRIMFTIFLCLITVAPPAMASSQSSGGTACTVAGRSCATGTLTNDAPVCAHTGSGSWQCLVTWRLYLSVSGVETCGTVDTTIHHEISACALIGTNSASTQATTVHYPGYGGSYVSPSGTVCVSVAGLVAKECKNFQHASIYLPPPPRLNPGSTLVADLVDTALVVAEGEVSTVASSFDGLVTLVP